MSEHPSFEENGCPPGEPLPGKTYRADGWSYNNLPRMTVAHAQTLIGILGEHVVWLTYTDYGNAVRGQCLISPTGRDLIAAYNKAHQ